VFDLVQMKLLMQRASSWVQAGGWVYWLRRVASLERIIACHRDN